MFQRSAAGLDTTDAHRLAPGPGAAPSEEKRMHLPFMKRILAAAAVAVLAPAVFAGPAAAASPTNPKTTLFLADPTGEVFAATCCPSNHWGPWSTVSQGSTVPGAPVTAVVTGGDKVTLFLANREGDIYTASRTPGAPWGPWSPVPQGHTTPGAKVTAIATGDHEFTLFMADPKGEVLTTSGSPSTSWAPWSSVNGTTTPGAPVTALVTGDDEVTLFLADPGGRVFTTSSSTGWFWSAVSPITTAPGAPVTAVVTGKDEVTLFVANWEGVVSTTSGNSGSGWRPWTSVSDGCTNPGATITAVHTDAYASDKLAVFVADQEGYVYTTSGSPGATWKPWSTVSEGHTMPGAPVTAATALVAVGAIDSDGDGHADEIVYAIALSLFLADFGGDVYTTAPSGPGKWNKWTTVSQGVTTPGGTVTAVVTG